MAALPTVDLRGRAAKALTAGYFHTCAILDDNAVKCWGANDNGQLGLDDTGTRGKNAEAMASLSAVNLAGRTAKSVAVGLNHSCAILDDNAVKCWGWNFNGQLGLDDTTFRGNVPGSMAALPAVNLSGHAAKAMAASSHTCVILDDDSVRCWGANAAGQLGLDSSIDRGDSVGSMAALAAVNLGGRTAKALALGASHTCAILDDGSVKCWGDNSLGQLGLDDLTRRGHVPGSMASLPTVNLGGRTAKALAAGSYHTCAILDDDSVKCWGRNNWGQLGLDDATDRGGSAGSMAALPTVNLGGRTAKSMAAGLDFTCAILDDGTLKCWGYNGNGQLGLDDTANRGNTPGSMASLPAVNLGGRAAKALAAGFNHACAILDDNSVKCWGDNSYGQLGQDSMWHCGQRANSMAALPAVNLGPGRTALSLFAGNGGSHTCVVLDDATIKCWGNNSAGQLGRDDTKDRGNGLPMANTGATLIP